MILQARSKCPVGFLGGSSVKNPPAMQETQVRFLGQKDPWRRVWQPTPVSCLETPMDRGAWRASAWGCKELDTTETTDHTHVQVSKRCLLNYWPEPSTGFQTRLLPTPWLMWGSASPWGMGEGSTPKGLSAPFFLNIDLFRGRWVLVWTLGIFSIIAASKIQPWQAGSSSPTRKETRVPALGMGVLAPGPPGTSLSVPFKLTFCDLYQLPSPCPSSLELDCGLPAGQEPLSLTARRTVSAQ